MSRIESIAGCFIWMGGENWNFSPETLVRVLGGDGRVVLGAADLWDPGRYQEVLEGLVGLDVVGVTCYDATPEGDLRVELSDGTVVEALDTFFIDSWILTVNGREGPDAPPGFKVPEGVVRLGSSRRSWRPLAPVPQEGATITGIRDSLPGEVFWQDRTVPQGAVEDMHEAPPLCTEVVAGSWSLRTIAAWRLLDQDRNPVTSSDLDDSSAIGRLTGTRPLRFETTGTQDTDLRVTLSNGWTLEALTDGIYSTWHLTLPGTHHQGLPHTPR
ncbi:hypothetical protein [uncultured Actinomyces sp.]|uniref:hypothetical protein n=1 Tax=uncultured Actinomyces sp. TaxID=249061 RepID=UPI00261047B6|nr:hypothetical protein [uncultured Actinomyces sp.]